MEEPGQWSQLTAEDTKCHPRGWIARAARLGSGPAGDLCLGCPAPKLASLTSALGSLLSAPPTALPSLEEGAHSSPSLGHALRLWVHTA